MSSASNQKITPIILSGGQGTRLWPLSRANHPKQFIPLASNKSLFEETVMRCLNPTQFNAPKIICAQEHRFLVKKLLPKNIKPEAEIIMEPCGRNTAAAICAAALSAKNPDDILLVLPSDHFIPDQTAFQQTIATALPLAQDGYIVTFGIKPTSPHTGFGYIESGAELYAAGYKIHKFHEKPDSQTALQYIQNQNYFWNAGIFMFRADVLLAEMKQHAKDILESVNLAWNNATEDLGDTLLNQEYFPKTRSDSIDYAVLEKTNKAAIVPANFPWSDLGTWEALWDMNEKNADNNVTQGQVFTKDVTGSYLRSEGPALSVIGMNDIIAISMTDAVFIGPKSQSEDVKKLVDIMSRSGQAQASENLLSFRPWGSYQVMEEKEGFKVKRITVDSGCRLSLQKHQHRSEHWVVVKGTATVTRNDEIFDLHVDESTYIPCGAVHRLENKGEETLELIEVQTGSYLGEDDIIRLEDDYNRNEDEKKKAISS
jgi:mannose-1-phosphate guanylyltransferase/mannose-6-phosphate isomerase